MKNKEGSMRDRWKGVRCNDPDQKAHIIKHIRENFSKEGQIAFVEAMSLAVQYGGSVIADRRTGEVRYVPPEVTGHA